MAEEKFHIKSDSPAVDDLMFWSLAGHESLSRASFYELTVVSKNRAISAADILGRAFDVVIDFADADGATHQRHCHGHAVRFVRAHELGRFFEYRITLRSWFWLLTKRKNSRIFQVKSTLEVFDATLDDSPIKRVKKTNADQVIGKHDALRYCVQFEESDYNFLSRQLEQEGIHYWFDAHDAPGTMHLADASDIAHAALPVTDTLAHVAEQRSEARFNEISRWVSAKRLDTGKYASTDSNFKTINTLLSVTADGSDDCELADLESFEFPGGYFHKETSEVVGAVRRDELIGRRERHWALTPWPDVAAGRSFKFEGDPDGTRDGEYSIAACTFFVSHPGHEGLDRMPQPQSVADMLRAVLADDPPAMENLGLIQDLFESAPQLRGDWRDASVFVATVMPLAMPYRPPRLTPAVRMPGLQSAIVVGPKGQENEPYVDEFGRVKVHFHWDRYDERNEESTCWVRVSQPWAGKNWGGYFMPRIGQEVLVDFLEGNPNRPVIVGRVYNDDQPIPYQSATQSGFKTRSTPKGGAGNYNEIMFEDKKGAENINIHAERNMSRSVEADDSTSVGHDQSVTVENDRHVTVKQFETHAVGKNLDVEIHGFNTSKVGKDYALLVTGNVLTQTKGFRTDVSVLGELRTVGVGQTIAVSGPVVHGSASLSVTTGGMNVATSSTKLSATGDMAVTTGGARRDITTGAHLMASSAGFKMVAGVDIELMANANINATSTGSNTTVLGSNSSGYIGSSSEANMGLARSTFLGLQMSNFLGMSIDNCAAIKMENTAAIELHNIAAINLKQAAGDFETVAMKVIAPGAGGGAAAAAVGIAAGLGGLVAAVFGLSDVAATMKQYADAAEALRKAAKDIPELPELQGKLNSLAASADRRQRQVGTAAGAVVGAAVGTVVGGPLGTAAGVALGSQLGGEYLPGAAVATAKFVEDHSEAPGAAADKAWDAVMPPAPPSSDSKAGPPAGNKSSTGHGSKSGGGGSDPAGS